MLHLVFMTVFSLALISPIQAAAKKMAASTTKTKKTTKSTKTAVSSVVIAPSLRRDRKALIVKFRNLKKAKSVFYSLVYQTNGKDEGVAGTVDSSSGNTVRRELLFGTCSSGVCRYHQRLKNMRFEATIELLSGKTLTKRYRIKI